MASAPVVSPWLIAICLSALVLSVALTRLAIAINISDIPNARSAHTKPTPRGGGLGVVVTFCVGLVALGLVGDLPGLNSAGLAVFPKKRWACDNAGWRTLADY